MMSHSYATVRRWLEESNDDRQSLEDDSLPGRPVTVATSEMVNKVHAGFPQALEIMENLENH